MIGRENRVGFLFNIQPDGEKSRFQKRNVEGDFMTKVPPMKAEFLQMPFKQQISLKQF